MEKRNILGDYKTDGNRLTGYAAVFDSPTIINEGGRTFTEVVKRGSFKKAVESKADIIITFNHDANHLLGRVSSGTAQIAEDSRGLFFSVDLPKSADYIRELVQRGDLKGGSFTFRVRPNGESWSGSTRTLTDLYLYELGPVTMPAYPATSLGLRTNLESWRMQIELAEIV